MGRQSKLPTRDEAARVHALENYDILDTPREREFDDVAELASEICGTPIAVVNLIGRDRQFFKAEVGLGVRETPFDSSFCAKAILEEDFLLVPDATKDARFDCNPLVTGEPHLRFYAGALLKTEKGHAIGTVCVLDTVPKNLTELQQKTLRVLARQVMKQLDLRIALRDKANAEATQRLLSLELAHRVKNILALVQAIASQTFRASPDRESKEKFEGRLHALSRAQDALLQKDFVSVPILDLLNGVLTSHNDHGRISIEGPQLSIGPKSALSISLLLNELATNAVKYGALSSPTGSVSLKWQLVDNSLSMNWIETDGPVTIEPKTKGFGSRLIAMGLVGDGDARIEYPSSGFRATFSAFVESLAT